MILKWYIKWKLNWIKQICDTKIPPGVTDPIIPLDPRHLLMIQSSSQAYFGDKMATILQTTFRSAFPWWKLLNFEKCFIKICSLKSNWQYGSIGSDNGQAPSRWQAIIWTKDGLVDWCIYVPLALNELKQWFVLSAESKHEENSNALWKTYFWSPQFCTLLN